MIEVEDRIVGTFIEQPNDTCRDYGCEMRSQPHDHIGTQPHLRRVISHGKLVDGKTGSHS